jgi:hypothetical protein
MSDPDETQVKAPAVPEPATTIPAAEIPTAPESVTHPAPVPATETPTVPEVSSRKRGGAVSAICDALKELFHSAPKKVLGWVCAGLAIFLVLCGVGIMWAFIMWGWPSMTGKKLQNWELVNEKSGKAVVELRKATEGGKIETSRVEVPEGVADPKAWALERYGEQRPLKKLDLIPLEPATDTAPVAPTTEVKP